jgi:Ca2+-binding EF-hand superfamily protein
MTHDRDQMGELREKFERYDGDRDGLMSFPEFAKLLEELGETLSEDEQLLAFDATDHDGDGAIDFDEFAAWWTDS